MPARGPAVARSAAFVAGAIVVAVALQLLRQPGYHSWNTVWGEDGSRYATDAYALPAWSTLFRGYAGYAQFVPRLLVLPARLLPVRDLAVYCAVVAASVWALLALFIYRSSAGWIVSRQLRAMLAVFSVAAPVAYYEVNANLTNLGWPLLFAAFWAVVSKHDGPLDVVARVAVVALAALTSPVTFLVVPGALVVVAMRRCAADVVVCVALIVASGIQLIAISAAGRVGPFTGSTLRELPTEYGVRVVGSVVVGERWSPSYWTRFGWVFVGAAISTVLAVIAFVVLSRAVRDGVVLGLAAIAASVIVFGITVWERGTEGMRLLAGDYTPLESRYAVVPVLLLMTGLVLLVDATARPWLRWLLVAQMTFAIATSFALAGPRSDGPAWSTAVDRATASCRSSVTMTDAPIPISPAPDFFISVPCGRLR